MRCLKHEEAKGQELVPGSFSSDKPFIQYPLFIFILSLYFLLQSSKTLTLWYGRVNCSHYGLHPSRISLHSLFCFWWFLASLCLCFFPRGI
ncbi:hypothetical protein F4703DRAFT_1889821, partial [Phycomyces blakesleeanus]